MYLYKIRYRKAFGETTGTCWRLIFVYGLMPWLHQYRIKATDQLDGAIDDTNASDLLPDGEDDPRSLIEKSRIEVGMAKGSEPPGTKSANSSSMDRVYKQQIEELKKENAKLRELKKELKKENAELKEVLSAFEEPGVEVDDVGGILRDPSVQRESPVHAERSASGRMLEP